MRRLLKLHPDSDRSPVTRIEVEIARPSADKLLLSYVATGEMDNVHISPVSRPMRTDNLWRHTCFEAFVRASSGVAYYEFNFAPSTHWAAYWFSDYRSGMRVASEIGAPPIAVHSTPGCYMLRASLDLKRLSALPHKTSWHLGLSAVIEDRAGQKSYWALTHLPGKPDFHHADCFVHILHPVGKP